MKKATSNQTEPYYYIALVLKGTEKQYLNLLKYVENQNGSKVIYQCKSLTYLRVTREDENKLKTATPDLELVSEQGGNIQ